MAVINNCSDRVRSFDSIIYILVYLIIMTGRHGVKVASDFQRGAQFSATFRPFDVAERPVLISAERRCGEFAFTCRTTWRLQLIDQSMNDGSLDLKFRIIRPERRLGFHSDTRPADLQIVYQFLNDGPFGCFGRQGVVVLGQTGIHQQFGRSGNRSKIQGRLLWMFATTMASVIRMSIQPIVEWNSISLLRLFFF